MIFDKEGNLIDFHDRIVHSLNKSKMMDYRFMMLGKNAFLFGDILNDIFMTKQSRYEN